MHIHHLLKSQMEEEPEKGMFGKFVSFGAKSK
jgi:hypothetical protein